MTDSIVTAEQTRVVEAITEALGVVLNRDLGELDMDTRLFDTLGLDSTGVLDLLLRLEETIGLEFDSERLEMRHFLTVESLADFVVSELRA
ncbi:acyl carrier protein [Nocardia sp. NPDC051570]|uniref:acyl carrier protein n=1 Tax=Nocardia sp. NPDC051570 TaxID=3364324 RepID=UPI0037AAD959